MKIGTKTTFGKLKVGDVFKSVHYESKKYVEAIKIWQDPKVNDGNSKFSDGSLAVTRNGLVLVCEDLEPVTYLGRGF